MAARAFELITLGGLKLFLVEEIKDKNKKKEITNYVLRKLPEWFGIEEAIVEYVKGVSDNDFFAVCCDELPVGFLSIKYINEFTAEIYVMGILKGYQNKGIGQKLVCRCEEVLKSKNIKMLMVKTLGESHPDENYKKTRAFYNKVGLLPLEEIKEIWGEENPCLIMIKAIQ